MYLEEHSVARSPKGGFCVFDSRGINRARIHEGLLGGAVGVDERWGPSQPSVTKGSSDDAVDVMRPCSRFIKRKLNCVVVVVDMAEACQGIKSDHSKSMEALKEISTCFRNFNERPPLLVLTHGDLLPFDDRIDSRIKICEALCVTETSGLYDIP